MCPYLRAATSLWPLHVQLQAGLLSRQASQTTNTPADLLPLGKLQSWAWLSLTMWFKRRHDGPTEGIKLCTFYLKSRALTPRPTMTNLDFFYKTCWSDSTLAVVLHLGNLSHSQRHLVANIFNKATNRWRWLWGYYQMQDHNPFWIYMIKFLKHKSEKLRKKTSLSSVKVW